MMIPLKQECAGQEAKALPGSPASRRHTKAPLSEGGLEAAAHPEGCALSPLPHGYPCRPAMLDAAPLGPAGGGGGLGGRQVHCSRSVRAQHLGAHLSRGPP